MRHRHQEGPAAKFTYVYSTGVAAATAQWQTYKSDASKAGIDINLVGQTFNTIIGESAPCAPMGPKCNVQVFAFGGWAFNGPGFEPTGEPLFATGAGSNSGNYSDPKMDKLINATHTNSSLALPRLRHVRGAAAAVHLGAEPVRHPGSQHQAAQRHLQRAATPCCPSTGTSPSNLKQLGAAPQVRGAAASNQHCHCSGPSTASAAQAAAICGADAGRWRTEAS